MKISVFSIQIRNRNLLKIHRINLYYNMQLIEHQDGLNFHEETDTFNLNVSLTDSKLTVILKDNLDLIVYSKEYTEDDVGKEIYKKMDLFDVYSAFAQTQAQFNQESTKSRQGQVEKRYQFGQVILENNVPCYKIEREGKVTCYLSLIDRKSNKQVTHESKLALNKIRKFSEEEILLVKLKRQRVEFVQEVCKNKREKQELMHKIFELEDANTNLKKELADLKQDLRLIRKQLLEKMELKINQTKKENVDLIQKTKRELQNQAAKIKSQYQTSINKTKAQTNQKFLTQNQSNETKIKQAKQEISKQMKQLFDQFKRSFLQTQQEKIEQIKKELSLKDQQIKTQVKTKIEAKVEKVEKVEQVEKVQKVQKVEKVEKVEKVHIEIGDKINEKESMMANFFKVEGLKVQYIGPSRKWTQFIINSPLSEKQAVHFRIKIVHLARRNLMIGIVDQKKQKHQRQSFNSGNALCYGGNGVKYPQALPQNNGFQQGDTVQVRVDRPNCTVRYAVNGIAMATQVNPMLGDISRVFMPYVELYNTSDAVEFLKSC